MGEIGLMERFADPTLFETLEFGDKVIASLITTLVGMGVTFGVLILIWGAIALMAKLLKASPPKEKPTAKSDAPAVIAAKAEVTTEATTVQAAQGNELIAVIMAAIAASEGSAFANHLIIKKINRVSGGRPAWGSAGTFDCIDSRKL